MVSTETGPTVELNGGASVQGACSSDTRRPKAGEPEQDQISAAALRIGMRLTQDVLDPEGVLLLAAGAPITPEFLHLLEHRGIRLVRTRAPRPCPKSDEVGSVFTRRLDDLEIEQMNRDAASHPIDVRHRPRLSFPSLLEEAQRGQERRAQAEQRFAEVCEGLVSGRCPSRLGLTGVVRDFANMVALDFDLLPLIVGMRQTPGEYLYKHGVNVSLLSMAMAAQLGLGREQLMDIGLGGLLADIGMLRVPTSIRLADRPLTAEERVEILYHPVSTVDYLEQIGGLPLQAKLIGYQSHERNDGSGYPRRRSGTLIHRYAKIVAIADAYSAMTGPRPYRTPITPYEAAKQILIENSRHKFDREIVRAFLDCMSMFPMGSTVELSDGRRGTVVRANPGRHTQPVIVELDADDRPTDTQIDLARHPRLKVVKTGPACEGVAGGGGLILS